jgi:hypothetical protein
MGHTCNVRLWPWFLTGFFAAFASSLLFVEVGQMSGHGLLNAQKMWEYYFTRDFSTEMCAFLTFDVFLSIMSGALLAGIRWGIWNFRNRKMEIV